VIVSSSGQVREVLPLIRIDVVILTSDSGANATTRNRDVSVTDCASGVSVSWMLQVGHTLEAVSVSLLQEFATLDMRLCTGVLKITTPDHEDACICTNLDYLKVVGQNVSCALAVLRVNPVGR